MPWTARLQSVSTSGGNVVAVVEFTDGSETQTETYRGDNLTQDAIRRFVHAKITSLGARDAAAASLASLAGEAIEPLAPSGMRPIPSSEMLSWAAASGRLDKLRSAASTHISQDVRSIANAAMTLIQRDNTSLDLSLPDRAAMVDALVAASVLTSDDRSSLYALAGG